MIDHYLISSRHLRWANGLFARSFFGIEEMADAADEH